MMSNLPIQCGILWRYIQLKGGCGPLLPSS